MDVPERRSRGESPPKDLRGLIGETEGALTSLAREAAGLLRWRLQLSGSHEPLRRAVA